MRENSGTRTLNNYIDLGEELPEFECSSCGWLHEESEAWGVAQDGDQFRCPECSTLINYSKEVRNPDHDPGSFTGFNGRKVRL